MSKTTHVAFALELYGLSSADFHGCSPFLPDRGHHSLKQVTRNLLKIIRDKGFKIKDLEGKS